MHSCATSPRKILLWLGGAFCALAGGKAYAQARPVPVVEAGAIFFSGGKAQSVTGSTGYFLTFRAEDARGHFRLQASTQFDYSTGTASIGSQASAYKMYGGAFLPGFNVFPFDTDAYVLPFLGFNGNVGWNFLTLNAPPSGVDTNTQGLSYGYEISSGTDIRFKRSNTRALRLRCSYWYLVSRIGDQSAFELSGFRFAVGLVF